jgi:hypothetical protein
MDRIPSESKHCAACAMPTDLSGLAEFINIAHALARLDAGDPVIASARRERLLALGLVSCEDGALALTWRGRKAIGLRAIAR